LTLRAQKGIFSPQQKAIKPQQKKGIKMKKILLVAAMLGLSSTAFGDIMLNGIGYSANELCFDGTNLVAQVTKSRELLRENGQGDKFVTGYVTVEAGDAYMWRAATSFRERGSSKIAVSFTRNGSPVDVEVTRRGGGGDNEDTTLTYVAVPSC
jgi:hypothetical protein